MDASSNLLGAQRSADRATRNAHSFSNLLDGDRAARAALLGWLPIVVINAAFVPQVTVELDPWHAIVHHLYDAGQVLALGGASWLATRSLWRLPRVPMLALAYVLLFAAHYWLLAGDLASYIRRSSAAYLAWVFPAVTSAGLLAGGVVASFLSRSVLRWLGVAGGLALAVANHRVLLLDYRGIHFIIGWIAATVMGMSLLGWPARGLPLRLERGLLAASALAVLTYLIVPGPVVRTALLGSTGALGAPFAARAWTAVRGEPRASSVPASEWFKPRRSLPPVPADPRPAGAPAAPIVVLLTVDALRGDVVELPDHAKFVPNLRAMAENSLRFARAYSPAADTGPSLQQLFLGTYWSQHLRNGTGGPHLADLLEAAGVATVQLRTHPKLTAGKGIADGFGKDLDIGTGAPSEKIVAEVLAQIDARGRGPLFIFSHILDAHAPYDRAGTTGSPKDRYLAEVALVDKQIGRLRAELKQRKLDQTTYLIISADHAEAFGEHGRRYHAWTMYDEMIRIPLLIEGPKIQPRRVPRSVSLIDVGPTVLSLFGQPTPGHFMGQSLVRFMAGETPPLTRPLAVDGDNDIQGILFEDRYKALIDLRQGTEELYDLQTDPAERKNLAERPDAARYFDQTRAFFQNLDP